MVEYLLPKQRVVGSNPIARSTRSTTVPQFPLLGFRVHVGPAESVPIVLIVEALLKRDPVGVGLANHIQGLNMPKDRPPHMLEGLL